MTETKAQPKLAAALVKAQAMMEAARKDSVNPQFAKGGKPGTYADLAAVAAALHEPFAKNGLGWRHKQKSDPAGVYVKCVLFHESGEELEPEDWLFLPVPQQTSQAFGGALTYGRRYTLQGAAGVVSDDDDGNLASVLPDVPPKATALAQNAQRASARLPVHIGREMTEGERVAAEPQPVHEEPPHPAEQETVTPEGAYGPVLGYGANEGKHASELKAHDLEWYIGNERKKLDAPGIEAWKKKKAKAMLDSLLAVRATKFGPYQGRDA